jgi:AraC-like DNA-binding protein
MSRDHSAIVNGFNHPGRHARTFFGPQFASTAIPNPTKVHPRVNRVLMSMPERLEDSSDVSLKTLAAISGLSPSRFMHVFTESVGMPLRQYILGLRLQRACFELTAGATVTSAACRAGFSDAAHLTRTFRRMLGITPTELFSQKRSLSTCRMILRIRGQEADSPRRDDGAIFAMSRKNERMEGSQT